MKDKYFCRQAFFIINQLAIIMYLVFLASNDIDLPYNLFVQLGIITLWLFEATYISYKNIRNNITLDRFSLLILIVVWSFLLGLSFDIYPISQICKIFLSLILFQTLSFILTFLFQDNKYKYKSMIYNIMTIFCGATILFKFISEIAFNLFLLLQFILTAFIMFFVAIVHRKRMVFVLKNQRVQIFISFIVIFVPFFLYSLYFLHHAPKLDNMGAYMIWSLCFASIYSIIFYSRQEYEKHLSLSIVSKAVIITLALLSAILFGIIFKLPVLGIFVLINTANMIIQISNVLLYLQTRKRIKSGKYKYQDFYSYSLSGIRSEEALKNEISQFLHDNVLQDLLSMKILVSKSEKPNVKEVMTDTLEKLSLKVRLQMEQYHPVILKSLTLKENYKNLIEATSKGFPLSNTEIVFNCHDDIFLADPYNVIAYRIMKELITNSFKHSAAKIITINLTVKRDVIILEVSDNGMGFDIKNCNNRLHKGLVSVHDTVYSLEGNIEMNSEIGQGTEIIITLPMKGERSYESFISR